MSFISEEGLQQLKAYKYKSGKYTWLDNKINPFWEYTVSLVPVWVAPNLLTFIGWAFVILSYTNMLRFDYTFQQNIPSSCFFWAAFCSFVYSTLDAIDGKQARRTGSSSPLGQLFDHGCDSFSIAFFILAACQAAKLQTADVMIVFVASQTSFWTSNWTEYNTGILKTSIGQFGVTEGEYSCVIVHLITGIFGQDFWIATISQALPKSVYQSMGFLEPYGHTRVGSVVVYYYSLLLFAVSAYSYLSTLWKATNKTKVACEFITFYILVAIECTWAYLGIFKDYCGIVLICFGLLQSQIICKMIICSVTKMKFQYFHWEVIPSLVATAVMLCLELAGWEGGVKVLWGLFLLNVAMILRFLYHTIGQITQYLNIYCFSLRKRALKQE